MMGTKTIVLLCEHDSQTAARVWLTIRSLHRENPHSLTDLCALRATMLYPLNYGLQWVYCYSWFLIPCVKRPPHDLSQLEHQPAHANVTLPQWQPA
jgi:hypothetical protein